MVMSYSSSVARLSPASFSCSGIRLSRRQRQIGVGNRRQTWGSRKVSTGNAGRMASGNSVLPQMEGWREQRPSSGLASAAKARSVAMSHYWRFVAALMLTLLHLCVPQSPRSDALEPGGPVDFGAIAIGSSSLNLHPHLFSHHHHHHHRRHRHAPSASQNKDFVSRLPTPAPVPLSPGQQLQRHR